MKVMFRTDASVEIGSGHLMRCLTLAKQLSNSGAEITFVCRDLPGAMFSSIEQAGFYCQKLHYDGEIDTEVDAKHTINSIASMSHNVLDIIVVDHYALDIVWEKHLRPYTNKLMVIDDLANRQHDCDFLLDQNYYANLEERYIGLIPNKCKTYLGPSYVLLREEFYKAKENAKVRDGNVKRVLVFFGGSDHTNQTLKVIEAIPLLNRPDIVFDIVVGASNPNKEYIEKLCGGLPNTAFHCQITNMAKLMLKADLAVGAGGSTMWERCYLGLPTITVIFASNQEQTTKDVAKLGAIEYLGYSEEVASMDYFAAIKKILENPVGLGKISQVALGLLCASNKTLVEAVICN